MRTLASTLIASSLLFMSKPGFVYSEETPQPAATSLQWRFDYDDAGRLSKLVDPAGKETKIHHKLDEQGRVQRLTKELSDASQVTLEFDRFGRRISMAGAAGTVRYDYDSFGYLTAVRRDGSPALSSTYDPATGLLKTAALTRNGSSAALEFAQGRLAKVRQFDGSALVVAYYDQGVHAGQMKEVRTPNDLRLSYEYEANNRLAAVNCDGIYRIEYTYDPQGRMVRLAHVQARK